MIDPDCHYGDHHWRGGVCSRCGKQLRCICGQFITIERIESHEAKCPALAAAQTEGQFHAEGLDERGIFGGRSHDPAAAQTEGKP